MNRSIWKASISRGYCPPYPCPACIGGTVRLVPKSLKEEETARSKQAHNDDDWDPEYIDYIFSASALCSNTKCNQGFKIIGKGGLEPTPDEEHGWALEDYFKPTSCIPMPNIIELPKKCPDDVRYDLNESFILFWNHRSSCANAIRYALEKLMTHQGVPTQIPSKKDSSKLNELNLHQRIEIYSKNEPISGAQLMALKWLGNTGSHGDKVNVDDLLDAFEILEHTLSEIIESKSKKIAALADKLTKKHS
jgi:Domain of unknown function (DUF4145)